MSKSEKDKAELGRYEVFASSLMEETESESRVWAIYKARREEAMRRGFRSDQGENQ